MDDRGHWHGSKEAAEAANAMFRREFMGDKAEPMSRPPFTVAIGERVCIVKSDGGLVWGTFDGAEKNKVTITPLDIEGAVRPYLDLAEQVELTRENKEKVKAQIWDNRKGKIILRTLPI